MIDSVFSHFNSGTVVERNEHHITYMHKYMDGEGSASIYPVFPGIEVIELDFKGSCYVPAVHNNQMNIMEINHCLEGRAECRMLDNCFLYISDGDLFMNTMLGHSDSTTLPLKYYHGMTVTIDLNTAASVILKMLPDDPIRIHDLSSRYFANDECLLIQAKNEIQHIFSGMYTIPEHARSVYYRLKIQELLLYLQYFDPSKEKQKRAYSQQQVDIVKQIQKQLTNNLGQRFTIEELAREYCISPTALKINFKGVYGVSLAAYMKDYRIRQSATLLCQTEKSIAEIASAMGYESQSKFSVAFKAIMKINPMEYRKKFVKS